MPIPSPTTPQADDSLVPPWERADFGEYVFPSEEENRQYDEFMTEIYTRHPNQWILHREVWSEEKNKAIFEIIGVYARDEYEAVADTAWKYNDEERARQTLMFTEALPAGTVQCLALQRSIVTSLESLDSAIDV